jgi:excisionase family DNA binding protein
MAITEVEKLVYSVDEACKLLSISKGLAYQLIREKQLPTIKLGKRLLIPKAALNKMLESVENGQ